MEREHQGRGNTWRRGLIAAVAAVILLAVAAGPASAGVPELPGLLTLQVGFGGNGNGLIASDDGQIACAQAGGVATGECSATYQFGAPPNDSVVSLSATPSASSEFVTWGVAGGTVLYGCGASSVCVVSLGGTTIVTGTFISTPQLPLTVTNAGTAAAQGSVTSSPPGISCIPGAQSDCATSFALGAIVTLTASAPAGTTFAGWGGGCESAGTSPVCTLTMLQPQAVTATFNTTTYTGTITVSGPGSVVVNIGPNSFACPPDCSGDDLPSGTTVTLTAQAATGAQFTGWGGDCASSATNASCSFTVAGPVTVQASFRSVVVRASVAGVRAFNQPRYVRVTVSSKEVVTAQLRLFRGGTTIVSRQVRVNGRRTVRLPIPRATSAGRATLRVVFTNQFGTKKTVNRNVRLPAI